MAVYQPTYTDKKTGKAALSSKLKAKGE